MKKKRLKAEIKELEAHLEILEKKFAVLEIVVKWQSQKLDSAREIRIKKEGLKRL
ncbi:hypothetical protein [Helicobacter sp.]|uniref:hypothetical protein n=1 Tax=Helicobacter sp. TaxID=218 RepID=UPI0019C1ED82|nr:hypothetical protein [Helicobacter sp.]MBD5165214.1 hypothetical protein [Helicobacter sp.]